MFEVLLKISLILTGFCWFCFAAADNEVLVKTKYGTVKGYKSVNYTIFLGKYNHYRHTKYNKSIS